MQEQNDFKWMYPKNNTASVQRSSGKYGILCRETRTNKKTYFIPHRHNFLEFECLLEGGGTHHINGTAYSIREGDFYALSRNDLHSYVGTKPFSFFNICLDLKKMPPHILALLQSVKFPLVGHFTIEQIKQIKGWANQLCALQEAEGPFSREQIYAYLSLLLLEFIIHGEPVAGGKEKSGYSYFEQAVSYIENHFAEKISLLTAAADIHISPNYLTRVLREHLGVGFVECLTKFRVGKAEEMILHTSLSLTDIALACGFGSHSSFSRAFQKYSGCSALAFRRKYKNV